MIYILLCFIFFIKYRKEKHSVSLYLFLMLLISVSFSVLTGRLQSLSIDYLFSELYIGALLYILFVGFHDYSNVKGLATSDISAERFNRLEPYIKWVNIVFFAINLFVFVSVFALLSSGVISVQEHKNEGGAGVIFATLLPPIFITLSFLFSPFAYFSLVFHFYYLINGNLKKAIVHLILSMGIVLSGLIALSRSAMVQYVLVYVGIYFFVMPIIPKTVVKRIKIAVVVAMAFVGFVFSSISESRFGERYNIESTPLINEVEHPQLVSMLDYYSQWVYFGPKLLDRYHSSDLSYGLYNSSGLAVLIQQRIYGTQEVNNERDRKYYRVLGDLGSAFHGCIVRCVFDYGYVGTILFVLLNVYFIKKFRPRHGYISLKTLLSLPILMSFCLGFFSGNSYSSLAINLAIIYMSIFYIMIKSNKYGNINSKRQMS